MWNPFCSPVRCSDSSDTPRPIFPLSGVPPMTPPVSPGKAARLPVFLRDIAYSVCTFFGRDKVDPAVNSNTRLSVNWFMFFFFSRWLLWLVHGWLLFWKHWRREEQVHLTRYRRKFSETLWNANKHRLQFTPGTWVVKARFMKTNALWPLPFLNPGFLPWMLGETHSTPPCWSVNSGDKMWKMLPEH